MTPSEEKPARFGLALLAAGMILVASPVVAQESSANSSERTLSSYLQTLADNPQSLSALMGAGRAALDLGDAQAALTFFGRAEELAPRDGRIKMWMGSALVQLEQPSAALRFFDDARSLGVAEAETARDRGLAYDLSGDPNRAQRDYALVLKQGRDAEVTRRMALSLAISGKKQPALDLLAEQLRQQDRAAWRVRAFVLALTGDTEGANKAAQTVMPTGQAAAMAPFFARLPSLNLAERAMAVHFGRIAGDGRVLAQAQPATPAPRPATEAGRPDVRQAPLGTLPVAPSSPASETASPADVRISSLARAPAATPGFSPPTSAPPTRTAAGPVTQAPVPAATAIQPTSLPPSMAVPTPISENSLQLKTDIAAATPSGSGQPPQGQASVPASTSAAPPSQPAPTKLSMADIAAAIATLRDDPPAQAPQVAAKPKPIVVADTRRTPRTSSITPAAKAKPAEAPAKARARHWVQVAGGAVKSALPREYARLKAKAPKLLGSRAAWTTPLNATNRLLVGPFDSDNEAQAFVNELAKADVAAFSWTSPVGQEIEKLPAR